MKPKISIALNGRNVARLAYDDVTGREEFKSAQGGQSAIAAILQWAKENLSPEECGRLSDELLRLAGPAASEEARDAAATDPGQYGTQGYPQFGGNQSMYGSGASNLSSVNSRVSKALVGDSRAVASFSKRYPDAAKILGLVDR